MKNDYVRGAPDLNSGGYGGGGYGGGSYGYGYGGGYGDGGSYGGGGYTHIQKIIIPLMRRRGLTEEQIHTITVENPKRALTFV